MIYGCLLVPVLVAMASFHQTFARRRQCYDGQTCDNQTVILSFDCGDITSRNISSITALFAYNQISTPNSGPIFNNSEFCMYRLKASFGDTKYDDLYVVPPQDCSPLGGTMYANVLVLVNESVTCIGDQNIRNALQQSSNQRARVNLRIQSQPENVMSLIACTVSTSAVCSATVNPTVMSLTPTKIMSSTSTKIMTSSSVNRTASTTKKSDATSAQAHFGSAMLFFLATTGVLTVSMLSL